MGELGVPRAGGRLIAEHLAQTSPVEARLHLASHPGGRDGCLPASPIDASLAAGISTLGLRPLDALSLPLPDKAALHLRDDAKDRHDDMPYLAARADVRVKHGHGCAVLFAFVDQVQHA